MRFHIIGIVILSLGLVYLLNFATDESVKLISNPASEQSYDFFMTNVDATYFSNDGHAQYHLQAHRSTHYPTPDHTIVDRPQVILYQEDEQPWYVTSQSGRVEKDDSLNQDRIELIDNVIISHIDQSGKSINIYTEHLTIHPKTKYISTDKAVLIKSTGVEISGVGMTANAESNQVKLLADVKGRYYE